jgi:hypothetical protein
MRVCSAADFVRITASWGIISAGLIAVGCGDPDLTLRIRIPTAQQSTTDVVAVELYEPSATQPLDCDAMAFDTVPQRAREISRIRTVYLDEGSGPIGPVDRLSTTLVVAHALSATSQSIASGCAAIAPFRADLTLELELEPTIAVELTGPRATAPIGETIAKTVSVADLDGNPRQNTELRWIAVGARGERTAASAATDAAGKAELAIDPPPAAGPVTIQLRARWASSNPTILSGFVLPEISSTTVAPVGADVDYAAGRFLDDQRWSIAAVVDAEGQALLRYCSALDRPRCDPPTRISGAGPVARLSTNDGDRLLLAEPRAVQIYRAKTLLYEQTHAHGPARRALLAGACPETSAALVIFGNDEREVYDANARVRSNAPARSIAATPVASGCVSTDADDERRTYFARTAEGRWLLALPSGGGSTPTLVPWLGLPPPVAFGPPASAEALLLGIKTRVDALVIARGTVSLTERAVTTLTSDPIPSSPLAMATGDIDGDGALDIVALVPYLSTEGPPGVDAPVVGLWTVLAAKTGDARVAGMLPLPRLQPCQSKLLVHDMDADGVDEVVVASSGNCASLDDTRAAPAELRLLDLSRDPS